LRSVAAHRHHRAVRKLLTLFPQRVFDLYVTHQLPSPLWNGGRVTLSFDLDYPEDIEAVPHLLRCLREARFAASFACIGRWIEEYPDAHRSLVDEGHEIVNHSHTHPDNELLNPERQFNQLSRSHQRDEIERCHDTSERLLKYAPVGFRVPHFGALFTPTIYPLLQEMGYLYSSSTMWWQTPTLGAPCQARMGEWGNGRMGGFPCSPTPPFSHSELWEFPVSGCPEHPLDAFDTWHAFRMTHAAHGDYRALFKRCVELCQTKGFYVNVYFDPQDVLRFDFAGLLRDVHESGAAASVKTYAELAGAIPEHGTQNLRFSERPLASVSPQG
jgi:hypothetical protein